jgi:hypothetical protein
MIANLTEAGKGVQFKDVVMLLQFLHDCCLLLVFVAQT